MDGSLRSLKADETEVNDWIKTSDGMEAHITPIDDLRPHRRDKACWCKPIKDEAYNLWSHNSLDRREEYEKDRPNRRMPS